MQLSELIQLLRGRATARFRDDIFYAQPLVCALMVWLMLCAARLSSGPLAPELVLLGLAGPLALLPLCIRTVRSVEAPKSPAGPRLALAIARMALLVIALVSAQAAWVWLTPHHE